jgi:hypothetical protein
MKMPTENVDCNWPVLPRYLPVVENLEVRRYFEDAEQAAEMLRGYGFDVAVEIHCGYWLVHWKFPKLTEVK